MKQKIKMFKKKIKMFKKKKIKMLKKIEMFRPLMANGEICR